jgi:hypothetical protein
MEICHEVDIFRCLLGNITHVQCFRTPNVLPQYPDNMPDNVCAHFWFETGGFGTIMASHTISVQDAKIKDYADMAHDMSFIMTGTEGAIRTDEINRKILVVRYAEYHPDAEVGKKVVLNRLEDYTAMENFSHSIRDNQGAFVRACAEGTPFHQDTFDAWKTHVVCLAAEKSAVEEFQKIELDYTFE